MPTAATAIPVLLLLLTACLMLFTPFAPTPERGPSCRRANRFALLLFALAAVVGLLVKYAS